jgi:hypothetical protein
MEHICCPYCEQTTFATVCTDCQAEGIRIQRVSSVFHIGRCHRCGHLDDEPCSARVGSNRSITRVGKALKELTHVAARLATRGRAPRQQP